jgi:hypothetical protein
MGMRGSASLPGFRSRMVIFLFITLVLARFSNKEKLTVMFFLSRSAECGMRKWRGGKCLKCWLHGCYELRNGFVFLLREYARPASRAALASNTEKAAKAAGEPSAWLDTQLKQGVNDLDSITNTRTEVRAPFSALPAIPHSSAVYSTDNHPLAISGEIFVREFYSPVLASNTTRANFSGSSPRPKGRRRKL